MYDIVIPLSAPEKNDNNDELKIALRSIERNADWCRRVHIVSNTLPKWLINVGIIPCTDFFKTNKDGNIFNKLLTAALNPDVLDYFVFWSDDQVALNTVDPTKLNIYNERDRQKFDNNKNIWHRRMQATFDFLETKGISLSYNWEAHTPYLYSKEEVITTLSSVDYSSGAGLCVNTLLLGLHRRAPDIAQFSIKLTAESCTPKNGWNLATCNKTFLGYNDTAFSTGLREELFNLFPDKSKYER